MQKEQHGLFYYTPTQKKYAIPDDFKVQKRMTVCIVLFLQERIRKIASTHMCNSSSEERTWIELRDKLVREFMLLPGPTNQIATQVKSPEKQKNRQPLSKVYMFKEASAARNSRSSRDDGAKKTKQV